MSRLKNYTCEGSYTVEYSMVMPAVIMCILLIVFLNLYLHDEVVMNSIATEAVYSALAEGEMEDYVQNCSGSRALFLPSIAWSCNKSLVERSVLWNSSFSLPLASLFTTILRNTSITLDGGCKRYPWNMAQVLRIKAIIDA